jgi:hypothetical protein
MIAWSYHQVYHLNSWFLQSTSSYRSVLIAFEVPGGTAICVWWTAESFSSSWRLANVNFCVMIVSILLFISIIRIGKTFVVTNYKWCNNKNSESTDLPLKHTSKSFSLCCIEFPFFALGLKFQLHCSLTLRATRYTAHYVTAGRLESEKGDRWQEDLHMPLSDSFFFFSFYSKSLCTYQIFPHIAYIFWGL